MMKKIAELSSTASYYADALAKIICVPMTAGFLIVLLLQVFNRYVLQNSLNWYVEVIKIFYLWSLFMGIAIALKSGNHIQFMFFFTRLDSRVQKWVALFWQTLALGFFICIVWLGYHNFIFISPSMFEMLGISEKWAVLPLPISGFFMAVHTVDMITHNLVEIFSKDAA